MSKRLLKAGPNTYIAHIFHIQTQAVKLSHPEGMENIHPCYLPLGVALEYIGGVAASSLQQLS